MTRLFAALAAGAACAAPAAASPSHVFHVGHVTDGDTIALTNGARVRLVQIDTPEVYFGVEWYASWQTRRSTGSTGTAGCCATSSASGTAST